MIRTGTAKNADIELYRIDEGTESDPAVVLVNGAGSTPVMWCRELIDALLAAGYRVVRFDSRDVGRRTRVGHAVNYFISDLAADLGVVLDTLGVEPTHLVGRSMGGMINMSFSASHPRRVLTSTLIHTSPAFSDTAGHGLPGPKDLVIEAIADAAFAQRLTRDAERIERRVEETRLYSGTRYPFNEGWARAGAEADTAHGAYAEPNHAPGVMASPSFVPLLGSLTQPTLVLHGTADPIIDVTHGHFLNERLINSSLIEYEGLGHETPPAFCIEAVPPILSLLVT